MWLTGSKLSEELRNSKNNFRTPSSFGVTDQTIQIIFQSKNQELYRLERS